MPMAQGEEAARAADCNRSPVRRNEFAELRRIIARRMALGSRRDQHVDAVPGGHDIHKMVDLRLSVVHDRLEPFMVGNGRQALLVHSRLTVLGVGRHHLGIEAQGRWIRCLAGGIIEHHHGVDGVIAFIRLEAVSDERV